jgi:molybdopterin-containing oxidoreductase family iron-sulfur binding subunit
MTADPGAPHAAAGGGLKPLPMAPADEAVTRRDFVRLAAFTLGAAAFSKAAAPLVEWTANQSMDDFLQKHFQELTAEEKARLVERLEREAKEKTGVDVRIRHVEATPGVEFGYALNLSLCTGCRKCVEACHLENNHDRASYNSYIRVFEMQKGGIDFERGDPLYADPVPQPDKYYMPVQCQQCANPPCVAVCPVEATWAEPDGVVVVDYNWCIGCRYCEAACPYHARRFNWTAPEVPPEEINPLQGLLTNRLRPQGVVEKCHFCLHRTREGRLPACLEACPTGARVFGDLADPASSVRWVIANKRVFVLKEELGTRPRFYYFFDK